LKKVAVKSMETAVEATASMEIALGALPCPGRVLEQRLLSPLNSSVAAAELRDFFWKIAY
jgi:hypothetical protein